MGQVIVHPRPDASLNAHLANLRLAAAKRWRVEQVRIELARLAATKPHRPWVTEDELKARRSRHLLEDNPCSG